MFCSKLEYCCPLSSPTAVSNIVVKLKKAQRVFTFKANGCGDLPYWERLKCLRIQSLQRRRKLGTLSSTFGRYIILNDLTNNDIGITFSNLENCTRSGSTACIVPPMPRGVPAGVATLYEHSFSVKTPKLLNCFSVCPQRLWTKMLRLYQHSKVHLALSFIRFQI